jgi:cytosine/adenosine deaminase-related metal-dependent hydrolase
MGKLILSAETVLPLSSKPLKNASVLISDGKIREIGKSAALRKRFKGVIERDLGNGILLPGFVNAHTHLELGWMFKRLRSFRGFTGWLAQIIKEKRLGAADGEITESVEEGIRANIRSGVTTVGEISSYGGIDIPLLKSSGLRTVLFREILDSNEGAADFSSLEKGALFEERLFPHSPYSCGPGVLKKSLRSHRRNGVPLGIHLAESADEVRFVRGEENNIEKKIFPLINKTPFKKHSADSPVSYLWKVGLLEGVRVTLVHMVQVSGEEARELCKLDAAVVLCARSNFFLQVGAPPVKEYAKFNRIGIGTDGLSSNYNLDFFEEMRFLHLLMSESLGQRAAYVTVYAATLGGASALYIEDKTGSIEPGKEADLIFLKNGSGSGDPYLSVISSTARDVGMVMVRGEIIHTRKDTNPNI